MKRFIFLVAICLLAVVTTLAACNKNAGEPSVATTDMLFALKNDYIGNNSADGSILQALDISGLGKYTIALKTDSKPYVLTVNFSEISVSMDELNSKMEMYSYVLLALIGNADEICWNINTDTVVDSKSVSLEDANNIYNNIKSYADSADNLQSLLNAIGYYK